jgi:hypothetical protein
MTLFTSTMIPYAEQSLGLLKAIIPKIHFNPLMLLKLNELFLFRGVVKWRNYGKEIYKTSETGKVSRTTSQWRCPHSFLKERTISCFQSMHGLHE